MSVRLTWVQYRGKSGEYFLLGFIEIGAEAILTTTSTTYVAMDNPFIANLAGYSLKGAIIVYKLQGQLINTVANETTYAKLYNVTDAKDVANSEISFTPAIASDRKTVVSGEITLEDGKRYQLYLKSSSGAATAAIARAKILILAKIK